MSFMDLFKKRTPSNQPNDATEPLEQKKAKPYTVAPENAPEVITSQPPAATADKNALVQGSTAKNDASLTDVSQDYSPVIPNDTVKPFDEPTTDFYSYFEGPPGSYKDIPRSFKPKTTYTPKPIYENCNLIILAVENTAKVNLYGNRVLKLISKIIEDNSQALFLILRIGNQSKYFDVLDAEQLKEKSLPDCLLSLDKSSEQVKLADALAHIYSFSKPLLKSFGTISHNTKKYMVNDIRIIFIGAGNKDANSIDVKEASEILKKLTECKEVKIVKYFCINDEDAIGAASIGFPIIGHIESNFYK